MALTRLFADLGQVLMRRLGDAGGPRADRTDAEFDNIITGVNNIEDAVTRISGVSYCIEVNTASTASTGAGPETLHSFSLPANSLANNEDFLDVEYAFIFAADDDNKLPGATFGGTEYQRRGLGAQDLDGIVGAVIRANITRLSTTSVRVSSTLIANVMIGDSAGAFVGTSGNGGITFGSVVDITGLANLTSNATTMTGQSVGVNAGDVTQVKSVIRLTQF